MRHLKHFGRGIVLSGLALGLMVSSASAQQVMQGRIWDFSSSHPDFETGRGGAVMPGQVEQQLGPDGKPVWAGPSNEAFSSKENFDQWYRDVPGVNMSKPYALELVETPAGSASYAIERYDFFPIDNELLGNEDGRFLDTRDQPRNFHYTMQLAGEFSFQNDTDHFTFIGDDDLWVFFGGRLGIDLGGTHRAETATITGAQLRELGLSPGESYPIDIFFAERQSRGSNFVIQTSFDIQPPVPERLPVGDETQQVMPLQPGTELVRGQRYWSPSGEHFLTLNPDGNLVVARADGGYVWGFDTQGVDFPRVGTVIFQEDGNLAAYAADGSYIWSALTENPDPAARLVLQPNGALQLATPDRVLWTSIPYDPAAAVAAPAADLLPQTNTGPIELAWAGEDAEIVRGTPVEFVSSDGTAAVGSRTVFILRNEATGQATLVPVNGDEEATRTIVELAPGTYSVESPAPSVGQFSTFSVSNVSATQITVPEVDIAWDPVVSVSFSIETQRVAVAMVVRQITANSVSLEWGPLPDVEVAEYILVRTDGKTPADNPGAGTPVLLASPTATAVSAEGLAPASEYTFTLFSTAISGEVLPVRTFTTVTANPGAQEAAYAVAANTILPTDFAALEAQRVGENWVRVRLDPASLERGSSSEMAGLTEAATSGGGCVVGTPFLATTDVAGDNSFYGVIDVCEASDAGVSTAIVNTDVPLSAVFNYFYASSENEMICYDPTTGNPLDPNDPQCIGMLAEAGDDASPVYEDVPRTAVELGTGEVQVTLSWQSGDDLDLRVTDPGNAVVNWSTPMAPSGGLLDVDDRGGDCGVTSDRVENVYWQSEPPAGTYLVEVWNHKACLTETPVEARVQVRMGGELIIDQPIVVGQDAPIAFDVVEVGRQSSLMRPGSGRHGLPEPVAGADVAPWKFALKPGDSVAPFTDLHSRILVAQAGGRGSKAVDLMDKWSKVDDLRKFDFSPISNMKCGGQADGKFSLGPTFRPLFKHEIELESGLKWDVEAGIQAGIFPLVEFGGEFTCELDVEGKSFQLLIKPIPINLELKPDLSATATGGVKLEGPSLAVRLGVASKGKITAKTEWCKWIIPCGVRFKLEDESVKLIKDFKRGEVTAIVQGGLSFGIGAQANIGIGKKSALATLKGGFSFRMFPIAAELKGVAGTSNCIKGALGGRLAVDLLAEAYILKLGGEFRQGIYDTDVVAYPRAKFEIGKCPTD
ncbi:fibro-slime domain-containing protein [Devosia enhydra]|uniref:Fibro-slime domain-containing protein n=1 Tax=Devosia enhydra TaxID=665118 RepID=A0A1K2HWP2_9HYPH|nr:fibro-slime domain-containing protein [Devosia enhydra]SFZ83489.1 fibro-slime domain-containing protein [Devosia enhydra]